MIRSPITASEHFGVGMLKGEALVPESNIHCMGFEL